MKSNKTCTGYIEIIINLRELDELDETLLIDPSATGSLCIYGVLDTRKCRTLAWLSVKNNNTIITSQCVYTKLG